MYELGIFAAFILWVYSTMMAVANANSQLSRNLAKVGMRLSWVSGEPVPVGDQAGGAWRFISALLAAIFGLAAILFSWFTVAISVGMMIYQKSKAAGMPQAVKEFRWKLRNVDMTREQILTEMAAAQNAVMPGSAARQ
ncbi:hypothetical protein [Variovorax sp. DXTD-1]|uniref:hypothetical protein n=1 Tax=Variovorax sp. DXTD-1 TaxID=2495592 RepID=UPI000F87EBC9|nr:hypothetical protein [Variovorax sp. DXTD-1]RST54127.1 hypothetical protein EJI00_03095 [Variovorax sp. DXTD-1]